jgi:hypothetical protein
MFMCVFIAACHPTINGSDTQIVSHEQIRIQVPANIFKALDNSLNSLYVKTAQTANRRRMSRLQPFTKGSHGRQAEPPGGGL